MTCTSPWLLFLVLVFSVECFQSIPCSCLSSLVHTVFIGQSDLYLAIPSFSLVSLFFFCPFKPCCWRLVAMVTSLAVLKNKYKKKKSAFFIFTILYMKVQQQSGIWLLSLTSYSEVSAASIKCGTKWYEGGGGLNLCSFSGDSAGNVQRRAVAVFSPCWSVYPTEDGVQGSSERNLSWWAGWDQTSLFMLVN